MKLLSNQDSQHYLMSMFLTQVYAETGVFAATAGSWSVGEVLLSLGSQLVSGQAAASALYLTSATAFIPMQIKQKLTIKS